MTKNLLSIANYFLKFMKWTFIIFMLMLIGLLVAKAENSSGQSVLKTKISINVKNLPFREVLTVIGRKTSIDFAYNTQIMQLDSKINLDASDEQLSYVLDRLVKPMGLQYRLIGKSILIENKSTLHIITEQSRLQILLNGKVIDEDGLPIPEVTVKVMATENSKVSIVSSTNNNGEYSIRANRTDYIQFSHIGYQTKGVLVTSLTASPIVSLLSVQGSLDEIQIIGYGTTTKRLGTGSVSKISANEIEKAPVNNVLFALQGKVAGMQITQTTGTPGAAPSVKIRGTNSIAAGTSPLYILDGIPVPETQFTLGTQSLNGNISSILNINPSDIESIDVLKDADATAIYGSRGANGVILISTKKGRAGKTTVSFNGYTGISQVAHYLSLMDVHQYNAMRREAFVNDGVTPTALNAPDLFTWDTTVVHNWQKELIGNTAVAQNAQITLSGGDANNHFYLNAGIDNNGAIGPGGGGNVRKSFRFNVDHSSINKKFFVNIIGGYTVNQLSLKQQDLTGFINLAPSYPLYNSSGAPDFAQSRGYPLAYLMQPFDNRSEVYNGQINFSYELVKGLVAKLSTGINNSTTNESIQQPLISLNPVQYSGGILQVNTPTFRSWIAEPQLNYRWSRNANSFDILLGGTWQSNTANSFSARGTGYTNDALIANLSSASSLSVNSGTTEYAYQSLFGRITYNYDEKYLANISFRRDGSSRFGPGKRFGNFGSVGLGWIFTKERFMSDFQPVLSYGKLRGSYGINGNDQISDYGYLATYFGNASPGYQGSVLLPANIANPDYRWEENKKMDIALELGFFNSRFLLTTDYYRNKTGNQLLNYIFGTSNWLQFLCGKFPRNPAKSRYRNRTVQPEYYREKTPRF